MSRFSLPVRFFNRMRLRFSPIDYRFVIVGLAVYFALVLNWKVLGHFYSILGQLDAYDLGFAASAPFVLLLGSIVLFTPFSFRYLLKPFFALLILTGALANYAMVKYGIVFDRGMIENVVETNSAEAFSYLNMQSAIWFIGTGIVPVILLFLLPVRYPRSVLRGFVQRVAMMAVPLVLFGGIAGLYFKDYASVGRNHKVLGKEVSPVNYVTGSIQYVKRRYVSSSMPFQTVGNDAHQVVKVAGNGKPTLMFLVIGETARAQSVQANGYARPTSEFTQKIPGMLAFQDVRSCGTATAVSVPCIFSIMDHANYNGEVASHSESLMDVVAKAGVSVFWKENDEGCKGACDRIPNVDIKPEDFPQYCANGTCHDEVMLDGLDEQIAAMAGDRLVTLHLMGSHGPTYYKRYPDEHRFFTPDCPRSDIENCTQQELINTYDNTIRYTDFVISRLVERLQSYQDRYNTVLLYVSDHGESLGESGMYLHGAPYMFAPDEQTRVPMFVWASDGFVADHGINRVCLSDQARTGSFSHDNVFSTVLGVMGVETSVYRKGQDIFAPCENATYQAELETHPEMTGN
ncbi:MULTISPECIES: phosphoethanolamine--lipid A transferase [Thalassospira]|uniref:phosphoethanolamine transferase n=1 Tax=Thalassospira TaxID=168934 RepID=UPI000AAB15FA|nr:MULTISPECIES: phosphoethanolamine--lipid A transferase [Thalassospira]MDM7976641.1 phosphoethanolamine--lipid A transferase [Thalassospira xiamenensis]